MEKEQNQDSDKNVLGEKENVKTDNEKDPQDSKEQNIKNEDLKEKTPEEKILELEDKQVENRKSISTFNGPKPEIKSFQSQNRPIFNDSKGNWCLSSNKPYFYVAKTSARWSLYRVVRIDEHKVKGNQHAHSTRNLKNVSHALIALIGSMPFLHFNNQRNYES